jgi:hypothetical protein
MGIQLKRPLSILGLLICFWIPHCLAGNTDCVLYDPELSNYQGPCVNGYAEGNGVATGVARYRGEFRAGRKHGRGEKVWANGDHYEGMFVNDRKEGVGLYEWGSGTGVSGPRYYGHFMADQRQGYGVYIWPSGSSYAGEWIDDLIAGAPSSTVLAEFRHEGELRAALTVGSKVCRRVSAGISESDLVVGRLEALEQSTIRVRIEDPGGLAKAVDGISIRSGDSMSQPLLLWFPCS